jgi:hypothetical protein
MWDFKHEGHMLIGACAYDLQETYAGMEVPFHVVLTSVLHRYASYGVSG